MTRSGLFGKATGAAHLRSPRGWGIGNAKERVQPSDEGEQHAPAAANDTVMAGGRIQIVRL